MPGKFSFSNFIGSVSKLISEHEVTEKKMSPQQKNHQQEIENSILVLVAAVIRCDRNFSADTETFLHNFFSKQFGEHGKSHRFTTVSNHIETGTEPFTKIACKELKMLTTHDSRISIAHFLFGIAAADDFVNAKETRCIHRIAGYLGLSEKDFAEIKRSAISQNNPFKILGVEENSSFEEVKVAYRKMVLKYHPDKRKKEVTEEEAGLKFREIKRAFEIIKNQSK